MISAAIDDCIALSHGAIDRVEIVTLVSAPALDHVALCIVTDPLAGAIGAVSPLASFGFLIDILAGGFLALVNDVIFKGVHFEMHVECEGREWLIHSTRACTPGETIGMRIGPNEIHIMARSEG